MADASEPLDLDLDLSLSKDKKKKKKKSTESLELDLEGGASGSADVDAPPSGVDSLTDDLGDLDLGLSKKKKKKKKETKDLDLEGIGEGFDGTGGDAGADAAGDASENVWSPTCTRDYLYEELLDRVFNTLRAHNPELTGEKKRTILKPPQVLREGTKKTVFANFIEMCKQLRRNNDHVLAFLLAELGTTGSIDGQDRLIVKGRFLPKAFEGILRRYVNEYVLCASCKSPDTELSRNDRLYRMSCNQCGAHRTVSSIKTGFQAQIGKRSRMRAAAGT